MASLGKRGKPLQGQSREIIYNVYKYFVTEADRFKKHEDGNVSCYFKKVQERVANATGISKRTLINILNEVSTETHSTEIKFSTPKKGRPKKQFRLVMDDFDYDVFRRNKISVLVEKIAESETEITREELQEIAEILDNASLKNTSTKKVIQKLESKFGLDLSEKKMLIDQLVMDYVHSMDSDEESEEEKPKVAPKKKIKKDVEDINDDSNDSD